MRFQSIGRIGVGFLAGILFLGLAASPAAANQDGEGATHSSSANGGDSYVLSLEGSTTSTNVSTEDYRRLRDKRTGDFLWFRRGGKAYAIEDRASLDRARELFAPLHALEPEQQDLRRRQEALDEKERELDRQEEDLDRQMDRISGDRDGEGDADDGEDAEMSSGADAPATDADREEMQRQLDELRVQEDELRARQREIEASNRDLEVVERSIDGREDALERDIETKLWSLIDAAVRSGVARPSPRP